MFSFADTPKESWLVEVAAPVTVLGFGGAFFVDEDPDALEELVAALVVEGASLVEELVKSRSGPTLIPGNFSALNTGIPFLFASASVI